MFGVIYGPEKYRVNTVFTKKIFWSTPTIKNADRLLARNIYFSKLASAKIHSATFLPDNTSFQILLFERY